MITIVLEDGKKMEYYKNGIWIKNSTSAYTRTKGGFNLSIQIHHQAVDEYSLWNNTLSDSDILTLYNSGSGISYTQVTGFNASEPSENYYNICISAQTLCMNESITQDISSCPITNNGVLNQQFCTLGVCIDNQSFYASAGYIPANHNYTGYCGIGANHCTENQTRCFGNTTFNRFDTLGILLGTQSVTTEQQLCTMSISGFTEWRDHTYCFYGCTNLGCNTAGSSTVIGRGSQSGSNQSISQPSNGDQGSGMTSGEKILSIFITMFIITIVFVAIGFSSHQPQLGLGIGVFFDIFLLFASAIPEFPIVGGFIPIWFAIMMGLVIILIGVFSAMKFMTGNNNAGG